MMVKPHYAQGNDNKPVLVSAEADYHPDEAGENGFSHRSAEVRSYTGAVAGLNTLRCARLIVGMRQVALGVDYRRASALAIELLTFEFPNSSKL